MECDVKPVRLAILGLGTVGGGALKLLEQNAAEIKRRTGRKFKSPTSVPAVHVLTRIYRLQSSKALICLKLYVSLMLM